MLMRKPLAVLALAALIPSAAWADRKAADSCAAGLPPISRQIYDSTMAARPTKETGRAIVKAQTQKLIAAGQLTMVQARPAAEAAGQCLELLGQ
jgi:hypothetical protein